MLGKLAAALFAGLLVFLVYRSIKHQPQWFSRAALGKSAYSLGVLALILLAVILFCIGMLRA